jgi:hypothetical protein
MPKKSITPTKRSFGLYSIGIPPRGASVRQV